MTEPATITADRRLLDEGTAAFLDAASWLDDDTIRAPSTLPGWSRAHVVAHVALNAEGSARVLAGARTGVPTPMYDRDHPRDADIESAVARPGAEVIAFARAACEQLSAEMDGMPEAAWSLTVQPRERPVSVSYLPWMRTREVWLHAIDLGVGVTSEQLPPPVAERLLGEVAQDLSGREGMPALLLETGDRVIEVAGAGEPLRVTGAAGALACWLAGRPAPVTTTRPLPPLPAWR